MFSRSYLVQMSTYTAKAALQWSTYHSCDSIEDAKAVREHLCTQFDANAIRIVESIHAIDSEDKTVNTSLPVMHKDNIVINSAMYYNSHSALSSMVAIA